MSEKLDVYSRVTNKIVADLERGNLTWLQPWQAGHQAGPVSRPLRAAGKAYRGVNVLMLWAAAMERGCSCPLWLTYKQAAELGGQVRKGEKGSLVVYANTFTKTGTDDNGAAVETEIPFMMLLHREQRARDDNGRIIATVGDYAAVRELVWDLFAEGTEATVKPETRETVAAVKMLGKDEVSITEIGKALKLDKGATSRRVADAVSRGYLINNETRKGRPARIVIGDALPSEIEILPHQDKLADRCSVAVLSGGMEPPSLLLVPFAELAEIEI